MRSLTLEIRLRPSTPEDHPFLRDLNRKAYRELAARMGMTSEELDRRFEKKLPLLELRIIELDGEPIGAVSTSAHSDHVFLHELLVLPDFQNRGIGSRVLESELRAAGQVGKPVRLHVARRNRAQRFYARHGFAVTARDDAYVHMTWQTRG